MQDNRNNRNKAVRWLSRGSQRWAQTKWRFGVILSVLITAAIVYVAVPGTAQAGTSDWVKVKYGLATHTTPSISKCVLSVGAAGGVGFGFGGPFGFLAGVLGGGLNCAINQIR